MYLKDFIRFLQFGVRDFSWKFSFEMGCFETVFQNTLLFHNTFSSSKIIFRNQSFHNSFLKSQMRSKALFHNIYRTHSHTTLHHHYSVVPLFSYSSTTPDNAYHHSHSPTAPQSIHLQGFTYPQRSIPPPPRDKTITKRTASKYFKTLKVS